MGRERTGMGALPKTDPAIRGTTWKEMSTIIRGGPRMKKYTKMERRKKRTVRSQNSKKEYEKNQLISSADFLVALMKKMITLIQKLTFIFFKMLNISLLLLFQSITIKTFWNPYSRVGILVCQFSPVKNQRAHIYRSSSWFQPD